LTVRGIGLSVSGKGGRIDEESRVNGLVELDTNLMDISFDVAAAAYDPGNMLVLCVSVDQANLAARSDV
jgi:hypothetical protein